MSGKTTTREYLDFSESSSKAESPSFGMVGVKMIASLLIVLSLLIGTLFIIRRYYPGSSYSSSFRDQKLKLTRVIEKINLAPKQCILLVWAIDRILVLAQSNGEIRYLTEIKDKETILEKIPNEFTDILTRENVKLSEAYRV
ncbi:MAG: flagellar biosynthetic protein FliO [Candidatus Aureabacteria bacterium]|nr:flagellar biosynthetic protein FliO [Candidatus Auribacterota bacterium]